MADIMGADRFASAQGRRPSCSQRWGRTVTTEGRRSATAFADMGFDVDIGLFFHAGGVGAEAVGRRPRRRRLFAPGEHLTLVPRSGALARHGGRTSWWSWAGSSRHKITARFMPPARRFLRPARCNRAAVDLIDLLEQRVNLGALVGGARWARAEIGAITLVESAWSIILTQRLVFCAARSARWRGAAHRADRRWGGQIDLYRALWPVRDQWVTG